MRAKVSGHSLAIVPNEDALEIGEAWESEFLSVFGSYTLMAFCFSYLPF